ncbi:hypothetical protein BCR41DRAFT_395271 [Lobosporangium transversale]|uniref:Uncharacterized protein n=1 Tax=Lobosporangium transversale TaxID=64571 RepID=A0A1Y2GQF8_9FUNG|nr:hypothetical protein BCR41DRAFT_395271 [Lobosporangium transversale]ORZ19136.1 hypothetical protein BCR41DRAFT_395271 [Lobosporangium transversale]|eukprot:XP_021882304.1 hypothetical protein BCR41DRAFT_395271 [Lobosporangium transversale]
MEQFEGGVVNVLISTRAAARTSGRVEDDINAYVNTQSWRRVFLNDFFDDVHKVVESCVTIMIPKCKSDQSTYH